MEASSQILHSLDAATLAVLRRHGMLRNLISAEVKEALLDPEPLDADALKSAVQTYRKRNNLLSPKQLQDHLRRQNWSQPDLQ